MKVLVLRHGHQIEVVRVEEVLAVRVDGDDRVYDVTVGFYEVGQVAGAGLGKGHRSVVGQVAGVGRRSDFCMNN